MVWILQRLFANSIRPANELYTKTLEQSRHPKFYMDFGVPDTLSGRFKMLTLHLFLVMDRLQKEPELQRLARELSQEAVREVDRSLRELGVGDLSVGRKVKLLFEGMYGRFGAYKAGVLHENNAGLYAAVSRNVFADRLPDEASLKDLVEYMRGVIANLDTISSGELSRGRINFEILQDYQGKLL